MNWSRDKGGYTLISQGHTCSCFIPFGHPWNVYIVRGENLFFSHRGSLIPVEKSFVVFGDGMCLFFFVEGNLWDNSLIDRLSESLFFALDEDAPGHVDTGSLFFWEYR